jgi:hypothetical protein
MSIQDPEPLVARARRAGVVELELAHAPRPEPDARWDVVRLTGDRLTLVFDRPLTDARYATAMVRRLRSIDTVDVEAPDNARFDDRSWEPLHEALAARGLASPARTLNPARARRGRS